MCASPAPNTKSTAEIKELGFSISQGVNWSKYLAYRPVYPTSYFERIYDYHSQKSQPTWSVAHDVGAGCGIASAALSSRFTNVIVSDPNDGYVTLARQILVEESSLPESKFRFLQESAEKSSVNSESVDLVTACECMHWMDTDAAIKELGRELKPGGTLAITHYSLPRIVGNEGAQSAWTLIWDFWSSKARSELYARAFRVANTGYDALEFPRSNWEMVKRVYVNAKGNIKAFVINDMIGKSKVKESEEKVWIEDDEDWHYMQGIDWLKEYVGTWVPRTPESEMQDLWNELESALEGNKIKIEFPVVIVLASKRL